MAIYRAEKKPKKKSVETTTEDVRYAQVTDPVSDEAMELLVRLMNDSPTLVKLQGTVWEIHCMKPGIQWLIAQEACKITKGEISALGDVITEFANNLPAVCRVLALALVNDKRVLDKDDELYNKVYDTLMWGDYDLKDWTTLLFEVLKLIDVDFFFESTGAIATVRQMTLTRKTTRKEQKLLSAVPNGDR